jgi:isopenicillin N synthase-like dioxygenase
MGSLPESMRVEVPVIDISGYLKGDKTQAAKVANELRSACQSPGFFQIIGHNVSADLRTQLLVKLAEFFALPATAKKELHRSQSKCLRGYESVGEQRLESTFSDQKEGFMIGPELPADARFLQGPNQWPSEEIIPGFREIFTTYFDQVLELSKTMFRLMALSLDLDEKYFDDFVGSRNCRTTHYGALLQWN